MTSAYRIDPELNGEGLRIGLVVARFNPSITKALETSCLRGLNEAGVAGTDITVVSVPGALEIPLALAQLAETGQFDGLVALGAVIRGETYHFELVSDQSAAGIQRVSLDFRIPIANGVLTTNTDEQAEERADIKGHEAGLVAVEMANLMLAIDDEVAADDDDAA
ncbi:MAG: 6,7-dimethyl-8-ribityllumazine synthase [Burkholderiaceae bacterium]|jgi:6,7-dimethyl-8-ribityllumazine synthase|nr:6,7-dimethyl-8-ribityllumazine synthase [Pseudomonadota bacterium]MDP4618027.1 6,7-dimethyl-8-ribityllumazine synthase [Burkholderiaceae bacterium]MDP4678026.1 6,7-dimethyl-8-ribityllumazine synthase [Burkholderiaceae bacterium]MDP4741183.1 6,7-dimethyl-8-ribityllumazine synthase [Burkholderiaceae bacterium]MDP4829584.1 6,7-dimethyl-8-ribityllumazine synthase [Burkholderiaceae bacterium]